MNDKRTRDDSEIRTNMSIQRALEEEIKKNKEKEQEALMKSERMNKTKLTINR